MAMDPHPANFPLISYVISRLPSLGPPSKLAVTTSTSSSYSDFVDIDIEQPNPPPRSPSHSSTSASLTHREIVSQMPHLSDPKLLEAMRRAIFDVYQTRSVLKLIGQRPDHEAVDNAKMKLADIEAQLSRQLEEIVLEQRPDNVDVNQWRSHLAEKENECRSAAEKEKRIYKSVIQLDEMHDAYEKLLRDAEKRLSKIYESAEEAAEDAGEDKTNEEMNEKVVGILQEASGKGMERVDLSGQKLKMLPEAFGKIPGLVVLDLSCNQLTVSSLAFWFSAIYNVSGIA